MTLPRGKARSYARFLLAYRFETTDSVDDEPVARGWIVRIPNEEEAVAPHKVLQQRWFASLAELPEIIAELLPESVRSAAPKRSEGK